MSIISTLECTDNVLIFYEVFSFLKICGVMQTEEGVGQWHRPSVSVPSRHGCMRCTVGEAGCGARGTPGITFETFETSSEPIVILK